MNIEDKLLGRLSPYTRAVTELGADADMFVGCFMSTYRTAVKYNDKGEAFVLTGDIPAMWLRDSSAQVIHYVRFADDEDVSAFLRGIMAAQTRCILADPYANAFNSEDNGNHSLSHVDFPERGPRVWERKYELDSLCWPYFLAQRFYEKTGDMSFADAGFLRAMRLAAGLFETETRHENSPYMFIRQGRPDNSLENDGHGRDAGYTGMIYSAFRPSDDKCVYNYPIYSNMLAAHVLPFMADVFEQAGDPVYAAKCRALAKNVKTGIAEFGIAEHPVYGRIYAYETDGLGASLFMDDANMPSLLSLPFFGAIAKNDEIYLNTRAFVLSRDNPYYYAGSFACGVGSPHTPKGFIWPIGLCTQLLTSSDATERKALLDMLLATHAGTKRMHESFNPDAPDVYTRSWFTWADSMFAEAVCDIIENGMRGTR